MNILKNPTWLNRHLFGIQDLNKVSANEIYFLKERLSARLSDDPVVSVCISAWNEELNLVRCLDSLSRSVTEVTFEILVVNNNSTDRTQEVLDSLGIRTYFQPVQGCGVSRQLALEKARGKYILLADADCYYSSRWIDIMYKNLTKENVAAVYSRHSFLGDHQIPRWKFFLYELGKDLVIELRNIKRPYLSAYGMSFGFRRNLGLKEGFVTRNIRGEDGRMCFDLMKHGKIVLVRDRKARVWTSDRNLEKDGKLLLAVYKRILREILRAKNYFTTPEPHDTKTSGNTELTIKKYEEMIKSWFWGN